MVKSLNQTISIAKRIVDGSITVDSVSEFRSILRIFPNDAALYRVFADLLNRKKSPEAAAKSYSRAATLNIESGMMLQAVICKILEWRLKKPTRQQAQRFYRALRGGSYHETPLNVFLNSLSFAEFTALVNQMIRVRMTAGRTVRKIGDQETDLHLIVTGNLKATTLVPLDGNQEEPQESSINLAENDFFGNIYPYDSENISQAFVETTTAAELVKISKIKLERISKKYPNIELGLIDLLKARSQIDERGLLRAVRQIDRRKLPIKIDMQIFPGKSGDNPIVLDGYTRDVSIGGMCIVLNAEYAHVPSMYQDIKMVQVQMSMPGDAMKISVAGKIVWTKQVYAEDEVTVALGIQYDKMTPNISGLLVVFADLLHGSD